MNLFWTLPVALPLGLLALAAWSDLLTRTIPDWISYALVLFGLGWRLTQGVDATLFAVAIAIALFVPLLVLHARGLLGGGDVKLLTALAFGLPPVGTYHLVLGTALAGGVLAALYLALRFLPAPKPSIRRGCVLRRALNAERWRSRRDGPLPYGLAIACGGAWALLPNFGIGG